MENDVYKKIEKLERMIEILEAKLNDITVKRRTYSLITSDIEDEITDDIHCCFRFIRHFLCFLN